MQHLKASHPPLIVSWRNLIEGVFLGMILLMGVTAGIVHTVGITPRTHPPLEKVVDRPPTPW